MTNASKKPWIVLLAAVAFAIAMPVMMELVNRLGHRIPELDRGNDYLKGILLAVGITFALFVAPVPAHDRKNLILLWSVKVIVSLGVMLLYEWNYGLDAYDYFERSQKFFPDFGTIEFGKGTDNLTALLWYIDHKIFPLASYHSQKILCSFAGLMAVYIFYLGIGRMVPNLAPRTLFYIGLCPSVLFWSSILGKDPINLLGSALFFYGAFSFLRGFNPIYLLPALLGIFVTALLRTWLVPMLVIPLAIGFVVRIPHRIMRYALVGAVAVGFIWGLQNMAQTIMLESEDTISGVHNVSRSWQRGGSSTEIPELTSIGAIVRYQPIGMFTALFRPLPGEVLNAFGLLAGAENFVILCLLYLAIRRPTRGAWTSPLVIILGSYILIWSMVYAFISPQNLGAAVRFRLQVMPMMVFLLLYIPKVIRPRVVLNPRERRYNTEST